MEFGSALRHKLETTKNECAARRQATKYLCAALPSLFICDQFMTMQRTVRKARGHSISAKPYSPSRRTLCLAGAIISIVFASSSAYAQSCLKNPLGTAECRSPNEGEPYCSAASPLNFGSAPQCAPSWSSTTGGRCGTQLVAQKQASDNWTAQLATGPFPICQPVRFDGLYQSSETWSLTGGGHQIVNYYNNVNYTVILQSGACSNSTALGGTSYCKSQLICPPGSAANPNSPPNKPNCITFKPEACPTGNPIQCAGGRKWAAEPDFTTSNSLLSFIRYYSSSQFFTPVDVSPSQANLGGNWRHNFQKRVFIDSTIVSGQVAVAYVDREGDDYRYFKSQNGIWVGRVDSAEKLLELKDINGVRTGWRYTTLKDETEDYDLTGRLVSISRKDEKKVNLIYSTAATNPLIAPAAGLLIEAQDERGRSIFLKYDVNSRLISVTSPNGEVYSYDYHLTKGIFEKVTHPNGTTKQYKYDESSNVTANAGGFNLLTGIINESSARFGNYKYDIQNRPNLEWHGSDPLVDRLALTYSTSGYLGATSNTNYIDALGAVRKKKFVAFNGIIKDAGEEWPCGTAGCTGTQSTTITYDANGYRNLYTDRRGAVTDYDYDTRGLELRRIEAKDQLAERITETLWHPNFRVPTERRICAANTLNTCPSSAVTPNLLSKTLMTYNLRGQLLTSTQIDPALLSNTRVSSTTYCDAVNASDCPLIGLVKTVDGPRIDVNDVTTYSYRMTSAGDLSYRAGDVWKVTNAANQVVEYLAYDGAGRVLKMQDANGVETWMSYHPRGWLLSRTVKGATVTDDASTSFAYTPFGAIERVTQPDGAFLQYGYDQAQRMTGISDNAGNSITYVLDAAGNRVRESTEEFNPRGAAVLKRLMARQYDQLSRMKASIRAQFAAQSNLDDPSVRKTTMTFDANGNTDITTDPARGTAPNTIVPGTISDNEYDPLNRLLSTLQDVGGVAAKVIYSYDALDRLTTVNDPKLLNTVYGYDGLSNLKTLTSPDTGVTGYTYDAAGNRKTQTDARGVVSTMSYDVLNRLYKIEYTPAGSNTVNAVKTVQFYYDQSDAITACTQSFPTGRMTRFTDESGSTTLCYDRRGNVSRKTQVTNGTTLVLAMTYSKADRLSGITYPSGTTVSYGRDGQGRITSVDINRAAFITSVSYLPFGPVNVITFANGKTLTKTYDQNYDIDAIVSTATGGLNLDYSVDEVGNITGVNQTFAGTLTPFGLTYDKLYRLTAVNIINPPTVPPTPPTPIEVFTYDATGNRQSKKLGTAPLVGYNYVPFTHKLANAGTGARSFDANGNSTLIPGTGTLGYDERNRLKTVVGTSTTRSASYNARGERVATAAAPLGGGSGDGSAGARSIGGGCIGNDSASVFIYSESGALLGNYDMCAATDEDVVYLDSTPIARVKDGVVYPLEADHLGSPRVMQNATGSSAVWTWNLLSNSATGSNAFGEQAPTGNQPFNLRFPGQYSDGNGLSYNYFRDYEAGTGRYVESDPIGLRGGMGTFNYTFSRPLSFTDPTGHVVPAVIICIGGGCEAAAAWCTAVVWTAVALLAVDTAAECANGDLAVCSTSANCKKAEEICHTRCEHFLGRDRSGQGNKYTLCRRECLKEYNCY